MTEGNRPPYWELLEERERGDEPLVLCIANQKGGVGKTTVAVNTGAALAESGYRVLLVDLDPQANATTGLGIDHRAQDRSTYDLLIAEAPLESVTVETAVPNLACVPGSVDLAGAEVELVGIDEREYRLAHALGPRPDHDVVIIDCPPSLGLLTLNALTAARDLLAPIQCEYYALEGLGQLLRTAERVRKGLNPNLRLSGLVLTMYDARTRLSSQVSDEIRKHFGNSVFRTVVPRSVRLSEAPSFGEPVITLDRASRGAIAFRLLATEMEERYALKPEKKTTRPARAAQPGPRGRGYGVVTPEPQGLDRSWPPGAPWTDEATDSRVEEEAMAKEWVRD
jgi:chromosome partitioning protein